MQDEWDFQRIRRFMDEQATMTASSAFYMNAADFIRQLPAAPYGICSTMASEVAATNSRLKAPAAAVELQPVQQSSSITSYMACQPSMNRSFEMPATDQSNRLQSPCTRLEYVNSQDFQLHNLADGESYITYCPFHACMHAVQNSIKIHIRNHEYCFQLCILVTT
jgi:hypothetical protein